MCRRSLLVLMWKHLMVRKRQFIQTFFDFFIPIIFFIILCLFRHKIKPIPKPSALSEDVQLPYVQPLADIPPPRRILYYPSNKLTDKLMDEVAWKLNLKRLDFLPDHSIEQSKLEGYYGIRDMMELNDYLPDMFTNEAVVEFHNFKDKVEWPSNINYTIRMRNLFYTNTFEPDIGEDGSNKEFGEVYEEFIRLQWTIDTSFIKVVTNNDVNKTVAMQELPKEPEQPGPGFNDNAMTACMVIGLLCFIACFTPFVFLMSRLLDQRTTGIQELVKMAGVSSHMISLTHLLNVLPVAVVYSIVVTILLQVTPNPLIMYSSGSIMFIILFLHHVSLLVLAFTCSYLTESTQYATSVSVFAYIATWLPSRMIGEIYKPPRAVVVLSGIFPHVPLNWYWDEVGAMEVFGEGITWSEAAQFHTEVSGPVGLGIFWLLFQIILFSLLAWYLSYVRPGPYGMPLPWNFLCKKRYWSKEDVTPHLTVDEEEVHFVREDMYFEPPPTHMEVGITIHNVSKVFPQHRALSNVSLDVYKGEICVLLGHNGAGKTTLMSIVTGMMVPTEGKVLVKGIDIRRSKKKIRNTIGLCPQHNLFFSDLTVIEHTIFFTMLKKGTFKEARQSSLSLLKELGLDAKANTKSSELSGGMKRRLQLACALAGGADVLVLDEPTAGLDVETRRSLWDLLLSLRGSRTVLLSTHFMEEADALGDRIAALHQGRLRCCATTLYLKKILGTGYRLSLTTAGAPREADITAIVTDAVPDASLTDETVNSLAYNLPSASSHLFPSLFTTLENQKAELGIESIGVGVSTLEEVFLKLCSDTDTSKAEDERASRHREPKYNKVSGIPWCSRIMLLLLKRQVKFCMSKKVAFVFLQILLPVIMILSFTAISNVPVSDEEEDINVTLRLRLDMYEPIPDVKVLYNLRSNTTNIDILKKEYPRVQFRALNNDIANVLRTAKEDIKGYDTYIAGIELNDTYAKILYSSLVRHAAPVAMNLLTNLLAAQYMPKATGRTITANNHPIAGVFEFQAKKKLVSPKNPDLCFTWCVLIVFVTLASMVNLSALPCRGRTQGTRHLHLMAGCSSVLHWSATLLTHVVLSAITIILTLVIALFFVDRDNTFNNAGTVGCVIVLVMLGILAFLASMYIICLWMGERGTGIFLVICLALFGLLTPGVHAVLIFAGEDTIVSFWSVTMNILRALAPPHALTVGLVKTISVARMNAYCVLNRDKCPIILVPEGGFDTAVCCSGGLPQCYFCWDEYAPTPEMVHLAVQFIVYMIITILFQDGYLCRLYELVLNACYKPEPFTEPDDMVRAEKVFVDKKIGLDTKTLDNSGIALLAHDLHKNYRKLWKSIPAVKGISFSVKKGECFGLLGVNGAGKSTTFKMLTVDECPTRGQIFGNGYRTGITSRGKYLRTLGYCPQFFGLDDFQTGRDNLTLLLTCRGLDREDTENEVNSWIKIVGLGKYADRIVSGYSGGMRRRLGAAAALGVGGRLALLDEPTSGVDVTARRRVWAALRRPTAIKRSVVLTSHSMDEMEALCDRIAIMAAGRICALGSAHELRAKHAVGHAVLLKLKHEHGDQEESFKTSVNDLKNDFSERFNCVIKDEHPTMLHYHINETLHYSHLFTEMEDLKSKYPEVLEDYAITETTLEEVFLSFAKARSADGELLVEDEEPLPNDESKII